MKVIVTSGATREPIDSVRYLSNVSTGGTGAALADYLASSGHTVVLLRGEGSTLPKKTLETEVFASAEDLRERLARRLGDGSYRAIIMCAAVADYRPTTPVPGKLGSEAHDLTLFLTRNPKILPHLKSFSPHPLQVIGFKLTSGASEEERRRAVHAQFMTGAVDVVVHNDLEEIRREGLHPFWLYRAAAKTPERVDGAAGLASVLNQILVS